MRDYVCEECGSEEWVGRLFDALHDCSKSKPSPCQCSGRRFLRLSFQWGLGAGTFIGKVLAIFLPESRPRWDSEDGGTVEFYPFLVICESPDAEARQTAWLPYWHLVTYPDGRGPKTKYGQWAPHMDAEILSDLVGQARTAGFLAFSD
jgi:hypothetical protein